MSDISDNSDGAESWVMLSKDIGTNLVAQAGTGRFSIKGIGERFVRL
ncbi:MAG: hypothetical protein AB7S99_07740 [Pseudodonghicola sp.]